MRLSLRALVITVLSAAALTATQVAAAPIADAFSKHRPGSSERVDHGNWDRLLKTYVKPDKSGLNRVDYAAFKAKGHAALKAYVKQLEAVAVARLDKPEQFAFWANLYNAKTIDVILDHYPVESIRKITIKAGLIGFLKKSVGAGGPWKAKILKVAGHNLSLDDIEHGILRPVFRDPRVHYAVNCASIGCPNLSTNAITGSNLEAELEAGARAYVNHPRGVSVSDGGITASSIYSWFQVDFGGSQRGVLKHLAKYADADLRKKLAGAKNIDRFAYDWRLNDIKK